MQNVKAKGAMSMLTLFLFLSFAISFLLSPEVFRNLLKFLVIALIMLAGLAVASTPLSPKPAEVSRDGAL